MVKKNEKGFTLIEILGVLVILSILTVLVVVAVTKYMDNGKDRYNNELKGELLLSGKSFYTKNKSRLPVLSSQKTYDYVMAPELKDSRFLTNELVDAEGRDCSGSYVYVRQKGYDSTDYDYIPCLVCEDENGKVYRYDKKNDPHCDISKWSDNIPPTCSRKESNYYSSSSNWKIEDADDDYGISYILIRNKKNSRDYKAISVKNKTAEEIRNLDLKSYVSDFVDQDKIADYEIVLLDQGGNETRNSCIDFYITKNACTIDWSGNNVIIKRATTRAFYGFSEIFYQVGSNTPVKVGDVSGRKIENKTLLNIPESAKVYLKDQDGKTINCDAAGAPICEFTKEPGNKYVGPSGTNLEVTCMIVEGNSVKKEIKSQIKDLSKIRPDAAKNLGTITTSNITHNGGSQKKAYKLVITIPYVPKANKMGTDTVTFGAGTVRNALEGYENKVNSAISTQVKVDSIAPTINYSLAGTLGNATALNDHGQGYYNQLTITATCTDQGSSVKLFKINGGTVTSPYTVTFNTRGSFSLSGECTDEAGNKGTGNTGPHRVLKQVTDCNICGIAVYKSCPSKAACGCQ